MRLALRGLWWRRGTSCVILLVIALSIAGAVTGPLFARAAAESALRIRLEQAPVADSGIRLSTDSQSTATLSGLRSLFPSELSAYFLKQVPSLQIFTGVASATNAAGNSAITWRAGFCRHLVVVSGHCPHGPSEAIVSARTLSTKGYGIRLGGPLYVGNKKPLTVVGLYRPGNLSDPFWFGQNYFNAQLGNDDQPDTLDSIFVDEPAITHSQAHPSTQAAVDYYLSPRSIRLDDLSRVTAATDELLHRFPATGRPAVQTQLPHLLTTAKKDRDVLNEGTLTVTAMLVLLGWLVLHHVISGTSESRASEIAAAKLRGWRPRAVVRFGLAETALLFAAGVPLGMLLGAVATHLLASTTLASGTPVLIRPAPGVAAAIATTGAAVAAVVASRQVLRRPIVDQWRKADAQLAASGRVGFVGDVALVLLACGGLVLLRLTGAASGGRPQLAGLLAPGLFIVAIARLAIRLMPALSRGAVRRSRASGRVAGFLAVRQVARRRYGLGAGALLAVAVGLAVYSVASISVIHTNQQVRAEAEVGAASVVTVQPKPGTTLVEDVDRADPDGRWAMAAAEWQPTGGNLVGHVTAVQSSRFASTSYWHGTWGATTSQSIQRALSPAVAPSIFVRSGLIRVRLTAAGPHIGKPLPNLAVALRDQRGRPVLQKGPRIRLGTHNYIWQIRCDAPCRLVDLEVYRSINDYSTMTGSIVVHEIAQRRGHAWHAVDAHLTVPRAWRAGRVLSNGFSLATASTTGLSADFSVEAGGWPTVEVADYPRPLPIVVAAHAQTTSGAVFVGEVTQVTPLDAVKQIRIVPRSLQYGVLTDLELAARELPQFDGATEEVWLSPSAPSDALARLRAAGLSTGNPDTIAAHLRALRSQGPAQTLNLLSFASIIAILFAIAAIALNIALIARRRAFELAALATLGIRRSLLLKSCVTEQLLLLAVSVVTGTVTALIAFGVGASSVPQFSDVTAVPLSFVPDSLALAGLLVALLVLVGLGAVVAGRLLLATARPALLREGVQ